MSKEIRGFRPVALNIYGIRAVVPLLPLRICTANILLHHRSFHLFEALFRVLWVWSLVAASHKLYLCNRTLFLFFQKGLQCLLWLYLQFIFVQFAQFRTELFRKLFVLTQGISEFSANFFKALLQFCTTKFVFFMLWGLCQAIFALFSWKCFSKWDSCYLKSFLARSMNSRW